MRSPTLHRRICASATGEAPLSEQPAIRSNSGVKANCGTDRPITRLSDKTSATEQQATEVRNCATQLQGRCVLQASNHERTAQLTSSLKYRLLRAPFALAFGSLGSDGSFV